MLAADVAGQVAMDLAEWPGWAAAKSIGKSYSLRRPCARATARGGQRELCERGLCVCVCVCALLTCSID